MSKFSSYYEICINKDNDLFTLYENGKAIKEAEWVFQLNEFIAERYAISLAHAGSESHQLVILQEHKIDVEIKFKW